MGLKLKQNISLPASKSRLVFLAMLASISAVALYGISQLVHAAQTPHVNVVLRVAEDGSTPFDGATYNPVTGTNGGMDANATNGVVRVLDYVKYRVEVSVNDTDQTNVIAQITADEDQQWTKLPSECLTSAQQPSINPESSISTNKRVLTCNLGNKTQGTKIVFHPIAQVKGDAVNAALADQTICNAIPNGSMLDTIGGCVSAHATASSDTAAEVQSKYVSVLVTARFAIDLSKSVPINPTTGYYMPSSSNKPGPTGLGIGNGQVIDWVVQAHAARGSERIKGDANGKRTFVLTDTFIDNNPNNNAGLADGSSHADRSSNARLYSWDSAKPGCEAIGTSIGSITCEQGAGNGTNATDSGAPITITLNDVDVNYPDAQGQIFYFKLRLWVPINSGAAAPNNHDILSNTDLCTGGVCEVTVTNSITGLDTPNPTLDGASPVITSITDQPNYGGSGEPAGNNTFDAPISSAFGASSWTIDKAYYGFSSGHPGTKTAARGQVVSKGATISLARDYALDYGMVCDPIDTTQLTFAGTPKDGEPKDLPNFQAFPTGTFEQYNPAAMAAYPDAVYLWEANPVMSIGATPSSNNQFLPASQFTSNNIRIEYTDVPHGTTLNDLRTFNCADDLNGDSTNDWVTDYETLPGGMSSVTAVRLVWEDIDWDEIKANFTKADQSTINAANITVTYNVQINPTATGYNCSGCSPTGNFVVDYTPYRWSIDGTPGVSGASAITTDQTNANFSLQAALADRIRLVGAKTAITIDLADPSQKVINSGNEVTFRVQPYLNGTTGSPVDVNVQSAIPNTGGGSPGNMTFVSAVPDPDCSTTNGTYGTFSQAGVWVSGTISGVTAGQPICPYLVTFRAPTGSPAGSYLTAARVTTSDNIINNDSVMPHNGQPPTVYSSTQILSVDGYQVQKDNDRSYYEPSEIITQQLVYNNLGSEDYTAGNFIDVLPFNGDNSGFTSREDTLTPNEDSASDYTHNDSGSSSSVIGLASLPTGTNSETFSYTTASPATIPTDPCHSSNQPLGFTPTAGHYCYQAYLDNGNQFPDGLPAGTGIINWSTTPPASLDDVTAIRWSSTTHNAGSAARTVTLNLAPKGNQDGDIYCNNFTGRIPQIALDITSNDICERIVTGTISGTVFSDGNASGGNFAANLGDGTYSNIQLRLLNDDGSPYDRDPLASGVQEYITTTNGNGQYQFTGLSSGDYRVEVVNPPTTDQTYDLDDTSPPISPAFTTPHNSGTITLTGPATDPDLNDVSNQMEVDFGYTGTASLAGKVWFDNNQNGQQDPEEDFISDISVHLLDENGNPVNNPATGDPWVIQTDPTGNFLFDDIAPGNYRVRFDLPSGAICTVQNQGSSATDSDGNPNASGCMTGVITVLAGDAIINVDLGVIDNPDEPGEPNIPGVYTPTVNTPGAPDTGFWKAAGISIGWMAIVAGVISVYQIYKQRRA